MMRLLLDENISWRLAAYLRPHCAAEPHVRDIQLGSSPDTSIWRYARQHGYDVLTKDEDFLRLVLAEGFPPRVVAVQNAQVPVVRLAEYLLSRLPQIEAFLGEQTEFGFLQLRLL
jgi:predicted nuclease of predicted toxin-antitoxin system